MTWRLELADGLVVRDTSSAKRLNMAVARLSGEKLDGIAMSARTGATTFYFDLGARIVVRGPAADANSNGELWSMSDERRVIAVLGGGSYETRTVTDTIQVAERVDADASGFVIIARNPQLRHEIIGKLQLAAV